MTITRVATYEYKNDYLYLIIRESPEHGPKACILCCGIDMTRFDALFRAQSGIGANPAFKELQLLREDVSAIALKKGVKSRPLDFGQCMPISPRGEGWHRESMVLDNVSPKIAKELLEFGVRDLLTKVLPVFAPSASLPKTLPNSAELQTYIQSLETKS